MIGALIAVIALGAACFVLGYESGKRKHQPKAIERATCCGEPLSEWFIDVMEGGGRMVCLHCRTISPWCSHAEFREAHKRLEEVR